MLSPFVRQVYALSGCICVFFVFGYQVGLQATYLPELKKDGSELLLTDDQVSWMLSALILMQMPAQVAGGLLADKFGRKIVVILSMTPALVSCILIYSAQNYITLLVGCCLSGWILIGVMFSPIIVAESVSPKYRGAMLTIKNGFGSLGLMSSHYLGPRYYWRTLTLCGGIPCVIGLILTLTTPESPAWLAKRGRFEDAKRAFKWYRGDNDVEELNQLIKSQEISNTVESSDKSKLVQFIKFIMDKSFLKSFLLNSIMYFYTEATGKRMFITFTKDIINAIVPSASNDYYSLISITYDLIELFSLIMAGFYMHKFGRRSLILFAGIPSIIIILMFCGIQYLSINGYLSKSFAWLSMILLLLNFLPLSLGVLPALYALMGEVIPLSHRGIGMSLLTLSLNLVTFVVTKYTYTLLHNIGVHGFYLICAGVSTLCMTLIIWLSPETNLKTLVDVENEMRGKKQQLGSQVELNKLMPKIEKDVKSFQDSSVPYLP